MTAYPILGGLLAGLLAAAPLLLVRAESVLAGGLVALFCRALAARRPLEQALPSIGATLLGGLWTGHLASFLVGLRLGGSAGLVYLLLFAVWMGDSGAYFVGRAFGRHRLAPRVSPKKSIEGLVGGTLGSIAGVAVARSFLGVEVPGGLVGVVVVGLLVAAAGTVGDLAESLLKRGAGVKDSGRLFPGHGGVLDRVDSLLFAAPVVYYCFLGPLASLPVLLLAP